jgi:hypothetical protein
VIIFGCLCPPAYIFIMVRVFFQAQVKKVKGKKKVVEKKAKLSPCRKDGPTKRKAGSSPEGPPSVAKARRTLSPMPFSASQDFMDTGPDSPPASGKRTHKPGKVGFLQKDGL